MRPDAHKKKASTQYKKKHGLSSDKKADAGVSGGGRPKTGARETGGGEKAVPGGTASAAAGQEGAGTGGSAATSHPMMVSSAPSFRRREVTSNWSRYEGLEDTEVDITTKPDKLRGADFGLLLRVASTSSSQFRFADEQDWEDDNSDPCSFLSVDCADLTAALHCEPLHVRLGLNTDTFSEDQIQRFTAAAERHKMNYKRKVQSTVVTGLDNIDEPHLDSAGEDSDIECSDVPSDDDSEDDSAICRNAVTPRLNEVAPKKSAINSVDITSPETLTRQVATALPTVTSPEPHIKPTKLTPPADSAEDDLDFLLSLEEPVRNEQEDAQETESDDLNLPCNPLSTEPKSDLAPEPQPQAKFTTTQTSTTNLEDWLDDFLDD